MSWLSEIKQGKRFMFGKNWSSFVNENLNDQAIDKAILCTKAILNKADIDLKGKTVIDIGCGSGLFTLVALELGAKYVMAFDYDPDSVKCTSKLLNSRNIESKKFKCMEGSILDLAFVKSLGKYDLVYSWGVLHHTGDCYKALKNSTLLVKNSGLVFIALYQKTIFEYFWKIEKLIFSSSSKYIKSIIRFIWISFLKISYAFRGKSFNKMVSEYSKNRGMNFYKDIDDWLGGYPYEEIAPKKCINFFSELGFINILFKRRSRYFSITSGCNEFIFKKVLKKFD